MEGRAGGQAAEYPDREWSGVIQKQAHHHLLKKDNTNQSSTHKHQRKCYALTTKYIIFRFYTHNIHTQCHRLSEKISIFYGCALYFYSINDKYMTYLILDNVTPCTIIATPTLGYLATRVTHKFLDCHFSIFYSLLMNDLGHFTLREGTS